MSKYLIRGINIDGGHFEIVIIAKCIAHAAQSTINDYIKEIISVEKFRK